MPGAQRTDDLRDVREAPVLCVIADLQQPPDGTADAYLRLHLLAHRLVKPRELNMDGIFAALPNIAWTSLGPVDPANLTHVQLKARASGTPLQVFSLDKFPRMTDYVTPSGVRVADADRVRLGAHLAEGTTVMHEGFVNFNAGTLGHSMVEGRISAGVVVGDGSDVGGGSSIMGTLSGGGSEVISIGERCLLGANAGIGISLGDDCTVEAGLYVTAGTLVTLPDGEVVKGRDLSGANGLLFRRNSRTGTVEALPRSGKLGRAQRGVARERLTSVWYSPRTDAARGHDRRVQVRGELRAPVRIERQRDAVGAGQRDVVVGAVGRRPAVGPVLGARIVPVEVTGRDGRDPGRDALVDLVEGRTQRLLDLVSWFQIRTTVPPGASTSPILRQPRSGSIQCQESLAMIRSNVRPRASQSSKAPTSTSTPWPRAIAAIRSSNSTPSTESPRSSSARATLPVPQPTSSTRAGRARRGRRSAPADRRPQAVVSSASVPKDSARTRLACRSRKAADDLGGPRAGLGRRDQREPQVPGRAEERARRDDDARLEPARGERIGVRARVEPQEERRVAARVAQPQRLQRGQQRVALGAVALAHLGRRGPRRPRPRSPRAGRTPAARRRRSAGTSSARPRSPGRRRRSPER